MITYLASDVREFVERADECEAEAQKAANEGRHAHAMIMGEESRRFWDTAQIISCAIFKIALGRT